MSNNLESRDYEKDWEEFWSNIICDEHGNINIQQLKKELSDFSMVLEEVPKVYCALTNNTLSKVHYFADTVISIASDVQEAAYQERFKDNVQEVVINIASVLSEDDNSKYHLVKCLYEVLASLTNNIVEDLNNDKILKLKNGIID